MWLKNMYLQSPRSSKTNSPLIEIPSIKSDKVANVFDIVSTQKPVYSDKPLTFE